jgi:chemotaxis protein methyltransferase CheR
MFYDLGNGQWDIPELRRLLEQVTNEQTAVEDFEVTHDFPRLGKRTMLVNARTVRDDDEKQKMLISIFDITDQRRLEKEKEGILMKKDLLLREMSHRIANSLQIIASILLLKSETVTSEESRTHLHDAHERIMTIATVQQQLDPAGLGEKIVVAKYLDVLCKNLARSMVAGRQLVTIEVHAGEGSVPSDTAVGFGLITTELVLNCLKHAFAPDQAGKIVVTYESQDLDWTLSVADDGVGLSPDPKGTHKGLGTSLLNALAHQLRATIRTETAPGKGMKVSVIHTEIQPA